MVATVPVYKPYVPAFPPVLSLNSKVLTSTALPELSVIDVITAEFKFVLSVPPPSTKENCKSIAPPATKVSKNVKLVSVVVTRPSY